MEEKEDVDVATIIMSSSSFVTQICNVMRLQYIVLDKLFLANLQHNNGEITFLYLKWSHLHILKHLNKNVFLTTL